MREANLVLRFLLELCGLAAAAYWGFTVFDGALAWILGLGAPVAVGFAWGTFVAPKAKVQLAYPIRLVLGAIILSVCGAALIHAGAALLGLVYIVLVLMNALLTHVSREPGAVG